MVNFCPNCGKKIEPGSKFCSSCGNRIIDSENSTAQKPATDLKKFSAQKPIEDFQNNSPTGFSDEEETEQNEMPKEEFVPDSGIGQMFFGTTGRLNRWRYFKRLLVVEIFAEILSMTVLYDLDNEIFYNRYEIFTLVGSLFFLWPEYCLDVRRLQDLNRDTELANIALIAGFFITTIYALDSSSLDYFFSTGSFPAHTSSKEKIGYFGVIAWSIAYLCVKIYLLFKGGTRGANQYGPDPLEKIH